MGAGQWARLQPMLAVLGRLLAGLALGVVAWGPGRAPTLSILLPMLTTVGSASRLQSFAVGLGYTMGLMRYIPQFAASWFDDQVLIGAALTLVACVVTAMAWSIGWSRPTAAPLARGGRALAAWLLALLPPFALVLPGHPLIGWATVFPGTGWIGLVVAALSTALAVAYAPALLAQRRTAVSTAGGVLLVLCGLSLAADRAWPIKQPQGVLALTTEWGALHRLDDVFPRIEAMGAVSRQINRADPTPMAVIWPESIIGRYDPALQPLLDIEMLDLARGLGQTQVIGMDVPVKGHLLNAALVYHPTGQTSTVVARQPVPAALWKPWADNGSFLADWTARNTLPLKSGRVWAFIFCYEEYIPAMFLLNELFDAPESFVVMANTWAAKHPEASAIQSQHSRWMAALFARGYLKAENRPKR